jgi:hypothetical protein
MSFQDQRYSQENFQFAPVPEAFLALDEGEEGIVVGATLGRSSHNSSLSSYQYKHQINNLNADKRGGVWLRFQLATTISPR